MILTPLTDAARYARLHPLFSQAFAWCADAAHLALPLGSHIIVPDDLVAIISEGHTAAGSTKRLESHRRCIDLQLVLSGSECMEWAPADDLRVAEIYDQQRDLTFHAEPPLSTSRILVQAGQMAIFWPEDAHKPGCNPGPDSVAVRKVIIKVAVKPRLN